MTYVGIDPSSNTGLVMLTKDGTVFVEREFKLEKGMKSTLSEIREYAESIVRLILPGSRIGIEGFAFSAKGQAVSFQYALGYAIRFALLDYRHEYFEFTPSQLKKFAGSKGNAKKEFVIKDVYKKWGYEHESNNVIDAFVLAQMVKAGPK